MSKKTDQYELDVAKYINNTTFRAERPKVDSTYADIKVTKGNKESWIEVKMNHKDRLANYRAKYNGKWSCAKSDRFEPVKDFVEKELNNSEEVKNVLNIVRDKYNIPLNFINGEKESDFAKAFRLYGDSGIKNKNLLSWKPVEKIGKLISDQYNYGKAAGCHYMQTGDDFFLLGNENPLDLPNDIPLFEGDGKFSVRFSDRGRSTGTVWMEIIPDFRIDSVKESKYSVKPGTNKLNPFE